MKLLAIMTLALSAADHWTTYVCLRKPVQGWNVTEANPISDWMFGSLGLVPSLIIDSLVTLVAVTFLLTTRRLPAPIKGAFFSVVVAATGYAVVNNLQAISALGLSPLGIS